MADFPMFSDFDFGVLTDPTYSEDAVREDLIAPLLKALGYQPTGKQRMQRSHALAHPFVMIGSQRRNVNVVPDYMLLFDDQAVLVLDAKRPSESVVKPEHVQQVFSYAIHPKIRSKSFALCNGHELVLFDIDGDKPVFRVNLVDIARHWDKVVKHFSPEALLDRSHREFFPDLGVFLKAAGVDRACSITFVNASITSLGRLQDGLLTATASIAIDSGIYQSSFDMPMEALSMLTSCLPSKARSIIANALSRETLDLVLVDGMIKASLTVLLGDDQTGAYAHDRIVPLRVQSINEVAQLAALGEVPAGLHPGDLVLPTILQTI